MSTDEELVTIGSSEVPIILGVHRHRSPWQLWPRLVGLAPRWEEAKSHMETGHDVEELLIPTRYRRRFDVELVPGPRFQSGEHRVGPEPWMRAHVDFYRSDDGRIVEAKKVRSWDGWGDDGTDDAPTDVLLQVVWQQMVDVQQDAEIAAWCSMDEHFRVYHVPWRPDFAEDLRRQVTAWYERHVIDCVPPDLDSTRACSRSMELVHPGRGGKIWRNPTETELALAHKLKEVRDEMERLDGEKNRLEAEIKDRIGEDYGVRGVARWAPRKDGGRTFGFIYKPGTLDDLDEENET